MKPISPAAVVIEAESLSDLAAYANAKHHEGTLLLEQAIYKFREAGLALLKAKAKVPYGGWLKWLKKHTKFGYITARNYIRVAENWDKIIAHPDFDGTLRGALRLLSMEAKEEEKEHPPAPDAPLPDAFAGEEPTAAEGEEGDLAESYLADRGDAPPTEPVGRSIWTAAEVKARARECEGYVRRLQEWLSYAVRDGYRPLIEKAARLSRNTALETTDDVIRTTRVQGASYGIPRVSCPALDDLLHFLSTVQHELDGAADLPAPDRLTVPDEYATIPMGRGA